jgi:NAD(P)H-hydrate epimerase
MIEVNKEILKNVYQKRPLESKKYDFGLLIIIGGSQFYSGSPALSAFAAFRSGCDMVRIIAPERAANIIASFSPNLAAFPLKGENLNQEHLADLLNFVKIAYEVSYGKSAVVIGGGMGRSEVTQKTILEFLEEISEINIPVLIDTDAIHAIAKKPEIIQGKPFLITPHTFEFFLLTKREIYKLEEEEKIKAVQEEAARLKTNILLKGRVDIISDGQVLALNRTGTPFMTVGGTGDTLAGIAGAFLARGVPPIISAQAAAFLNGLAGEKASEKFGESMTATDLIEEIPNVLKESL